MNAPQPTAAKPRFRWLKGAVLISGGLILIALAGTVIYAHNLFQNAQPVYSGTEKLSGLSAPVRVYRDNHGIPHIFADSRTDAIRTLGYLHAGERLFQMEMNRRAGQGRLSEVVGADMLPVDKFIRTLGLYTLAQSSFKAMSPEAQQLLTAYSDGVNDWLNTHRTHMPPEFKLLGITPEAWQPADSVVWGKLMALQLSKNRELEVLRATMKQKMSPDQFAQFFPAGIGDVPVTISPKQTGHTDITPPVDQAGELLGKVTGLAHGASNEWVVSGSRTASGKPVLANDPHLGLEAPILWYLARIVTPDHELRGATVPGLPIVLLGQNDDIAWGLTTTGSDVQDFFIETLDEKNPDQYVTPQGSADFVKREEIIHVKGGSDVTLSVRTTRHGPVMSDINPALAALAGEGKVMALAFAGLQGDDTTSEALLRLNMAKDWDSFKDALQLYQAPPQNLVYADVKGNIGYINPGLVPVRKHGDGLMPVDGATGENDWVGMIPFNSLPQIYNPPAGFVFNANNAVADGGYPRWLGVDYEEAYRARRLQSFFNTIAKHDLDSSAMMQADNVSLAARDLLPKLLALKTEKEHLNKALDLLRAWDGTMMADKPEPLIFDAWLYFMNRRLFDQFGDVNDRGPLKAAVIEAVLDGDGKVWCAADDAQPDAPANCDWVKEAALGDALDWIAARQGGDLSAWRWGKAHHTLLKHKVWSHVPGLSALTDIIMPSNGDFYTLNRGGSFEMKKPEIFYRDHGGGFRGLYDLADPTQSRFMITTGESGHIFSPHYADLAPLWNDVKSITLTGSEEDLSADGASLLTLTP